MFEHIEMLDELNAGLAAQLRGYAEAFDLVAMEELLGNNEASA